MADILALAALAKAGKNDVTIERTGLVELPLAVQPDVTFEVSGLGSGTITYVRVADVAPTYSQWNGGLVVIDDGKYHQEEPISAASDTLIDISAAFGVPATMVTSDIGWGQLCSIEQSTELVPSAGTYMVSDLIEMGVIDDITVYYNGVVSETITPHASYSGINEMTAGVTDLPTNVLYMQINSSGDEIKNIYLGVNEKAAKLTVPQPTVPEYYDVTFTGVTTLLEASNTASCDKTFAEITAAIAAGKIVRYFYSYTRNPYSGTEKYELIPVVRVSNLSNQQILDIRAYTNCDPKDEGGGFMITISCKIDSSSITCYFNDNRVY